VGTLGSGRLRAVGRNVLRSGAAIVAAYVLMGGATGDHAATARAGISPVSVQVRLTSLGRVIPQSFLGLSVEVNELSSYAQAGAVFGRAISLLRASGGGPIVLRVGGKSADDAYWDTSTRGLPSWVFEIDDGWLRQLASLAERDRLEVTLDLNLAVHSPSMEASFARAALEDLGPTRLVGLAIGNEPDLFRFQPGLNAESHAGVALGARREWTRGYSPVQYRRDYLAYARALQQAVPSVALAGPETTSPAPAWLDAVTGLGRLGPRALTVHRYPFSSCWARDSPFYPRLFSLLGERASAGLAHGLRGAIGLAHRDGQSLWVSELNSASCGGSPRVARSFATALWAPDVLFELVHAGVDGVNWHMRPEMPNAAFELRGAAIEPMPELYGLAVFAQMLGAEARCEAVRVSSVVGLHLKVWAVTSQQGTSVLLINKGRSAATVSLHVGEARGAARIQRLLAPAVSSDSGVTFGGQWIGADGRWHGRKRIELVRPQLRAYRFSVPGYSAAVVRLP
jgi:hypothetical protein